MERLVEINEVAPGDTVPPSALRLSRVSVLGEGVCIIADGYSPTPVVEYGQPGSKNHAVQGVNCPVFRKNSRCQGCPKNQ